MLTLSPTPGALPPDGANIQGDGCSSWTVADVPEPTWPRYRWLASDVLILSAFAGKLQPRACEAAVVLLANLAQNSQDGLDDALAIAAQGSFNLYDSKALSTEVRDWLDQLPANRRTELLGEAERLARHILSV